MLIGLSLKLASKRWSSLIHQPAPLVLCRLQSNTASGRPLHAGRHRLCSRKRLFRRPRALQPFIIYRFWPSIICIINFGTSSASSIRHHQDAELKRCLVGVASRLRLRVIVERESRRHLGPVSRWLVVFHALNGAVVRRQSPWWLTCTIFCSTSLLRT